MKSFVGGRPFGVGEGFQRFEQGLERSPVDLARSVASWMDGAGWMVFGRVAQDVIVACGFRKSRARHQLVFVEGCYWDMVGGGVDDPSAQGNVQ